MMHWAGALAVAAVVGLLALVFVGCGGSPDRGRVADGHPSIVPVDLASIPDAVPRHEPLSRYGNPPEYDVMVTPLARNPEDPLHRVRIGPLEGAAAVQEVAERLHRAALEDYRVVVEQLQ